ncbi:MAG: hypothetical protein M1827_004969 [Pycnora praestabilis]|nr:MAG: hypothetical protein M1827_004969 [Pycnora praestabilis]
MLDSWLEESDPSFRRQLAALATLPNSGQPKDSRTKTKTSTSLAVSTRSRTTINSTVSSNATEEVPQLTRSDSVNSSSDTSSLRTSLGGELAGYYLRSIEEDWEDGAIESPPSRAPSMTFEPVFPCAFRFLDCPHVFLSSDQWLAHSIVHFKGRSPPTRTSCCICNISFENSNGRVCWEARMDHVAQHHIAGHDLSYTRDFELYRWLWNRKLITDAERQQLTQGTDGAYTVSGRRMGR